MSEYVEEVRELGKEVLELIGEGLWVPDRSAFSRLITHVDADSIFRLNYYPPLDDDDDDDDDDDNKIGFGEHTDPQIITLLRSNDVAGLHISMHRHHHRPVWVPVTPHPNAFFVLVGDVLQAMTNGRFKSVRHRAVVNSYKPRMSMAYFAAPSLHQWISPLLTSQEKKLYRSFTWGEYKRAAYSKRLGDTRLDLFLIDPNKS